MTVAVVQATVTHTNIYYTYLGLPKDCVTCHSFLSVLPFIMFLLSTSQAPAWEPGSWPPRLFPLLWLPCPGFKPQLFWSRITLLLSPKRRRLLSRWIGLDLIPSHRSHKLNRYIQGLPMVRSQSPAPTERAELDTCLQLVQLEGLAKAAGKSGGQSLQQSGQTLRRKTNFWSQSRQGRD